MVIYYKFFKGLRGSVGERTSRDFPLKSRRSVLHYKITMWLENENMRISQDGRGWVFDNIRIIRFCVKSVDSSIQFSVHQSLSTLFS